ncbi:MAG: HD domain-containing protein [Eubacterium aggregans]|uniref:HD domain-containing protein n=1 Tax=Eubacterium aggregans TaxID=81409 RepID=UPI0023F2750A|nr:HD domain-containing protein [Eubacterium aggregans]MDD4691993.1 HD domain-containing protein [Eubacterium aggregans]MEA5072907.1 HD domain-containing protein [Eubacterium aggregans]
MDTNQLTLAMMEYYNGDPKRIQHFLKVHSLASLIGQMEKIDSVDQEVLEVAALVHDIGIKVGEEKYGRCDGKIQEEMGPAEAEALLDRLGYDDVIIARVSSLVANHHSYTDIQGKDHQILVEADFLVNLYEDGAEKKSVMAAYRNIFKTHAGKKLCRMMYGLGE